MSEQMTQYQRDFVRMLDSMRDTCKGEITCAGIKMKECKECPLTKFCENDIWFNAEKIIEIVTQWAKEHPPVTYEQKYEETFGVKPLHIDRCTKIYLCPKHAGFDIGINCNAQSCETCKEKFWHSEYKEPKKEGDA